MATVRYSADFEHDVTRICEHMRDKEAQSMGLSNETFHLGMRSYYFEHMVWDGRRDLRDAIPVDWLSRKDYFNLSITHGEGARVVLAVDQLKDTFDRPGDFNYTVRFDFNLLHDLAQKYADIAKMRDAIVAAVEHHRHEVLWGKRIRQVRDVFKAFPSINAALKAHPELQMYVPRSYIDRINQKVARSTPATAQQHGVDTKELAAAAVAAKLLESM